MKIRYKNLFLSSVLLLIIMKLQILYISNGNRYIEGISHRLSVTSQARLFTNNKKLKSLFSYITPMKGFVLGKKCPLS